MKAHIYKYTAKTLTNGKEYNIRYVGFFKDKKIFEKFINYQNALSKGLIYYVSKTDKKHNIMSACRLVPPMNPVWISKNTHILVK